MKPTLRSLTLPVCLTVALTAPAVAAVPQVTRLYELSDFSGPIPYSDVWVHVDRQRDEVYTTTGRTVRVFNAAGMEIYRFGEDWDLGMIYGLAVEPEGDILILAHRMVSERDRSWDVIRCDYRGEPLARLDIDLPDDLADFSPDRLLYREGEIHLVSTTGLAAVVLDSTGGFVRSLDLAELLPVEDPESEHIFGVGLDAGGSLLLTVPVLFKAYIVSPAGGVRRFGTPGSAPGLFGIASGIAADENGNVFVADRLRNVVMIFDPSLGFVHEFGLESGSLAVVRPTELTAGNDGRLYVTQARNQGVAVFALTTRGAALAAESESAEQGGDAKTRTPNEPATVNREAPRASSRFASEQDSLNGEEEPN